MGNVVWTAEDQAQHEFWSTFGRDHVTALPVEAWLSLYEADPLLWSGVIDGRALTLTWNHAEAAVELSIDGQATPVDMSIDAAGRPMWSNADLELFGYIDVDEERGRVVMQIQVGELYYRVLARDPGRTDSETGSIAVVGARIKMSCRVCRCHGKIFPHGTCTDDGCDTSASCKKGNHCRWTAAACAE